MLSLYRLDGSGARGEHRDALRHRHVHRVQRSLREMGGNPAAGDLGEHKREPVGPWQAIEDFGARGCRPDECDRGERDPHGAKPTPGRSNKKARPLARSGFYFRRWSGGNLLTRTRLHTITGANPFHGPARDGKARYQAAIGAMQLIEV